EAPRSRVTERADEDAAATVVVGTGHDRRIIGPDRTEPEIGFGPDGFQGRRLEVEDHEFAGEVGLRGPELLTADQGCGPPGPDGVAAQSVVCGRFRQAAEFGFAVEVDAPDLTGLELTGNRLLELHANEAGLVVDGPVDEAARGQGQVP